MFCIIELHKAELTFSS
uniref:Uncharacterized protein n=1 Tax=Anguilla anguilla TaxID=7936 RepID=A0A0E9U5C2_ANGAN